MILLDTHAVIWLGSGHRRARALRRYERELVVSPVTVLELRFLFELGRTTSWRRATVADVVADPRWTIDYPSTEDWFEAAALVPWTHDPFDRLLAAHALHRSYRLATGDAKILENMPASNLLEL
jgi:PIN domain nuclease of toxin-antitoxin system